jgi:hypothetical protein
MASRLCFISTPVESSSLFQEIEVDFDYFPGFSLSQKQKSVDSLHCSINAAFPGLKLLEVSTKSKNSLGNMLSAFHLKLSHPVCGNEYPLENVFQSSKLFENGKQYLDLLNIHPGKAKKDLRLRNSGKLVGFRFNDIEWPLDPPSMFYDWLYIEAVRNKEDLLNELKEYDAFTDIEFNHHKSLNCQARSAAVVVSLLRKSMLKKPSDCLKIEDMKSFYPQKGTVPRRVSKSTSGSQDRACS